MNKLYGLYDTQFYYSTTSNNYIVLPIIISSNLNKIYMLIGGYKLFL